MDEGSDQFMGISVPPVLEEYEVKAVLNTPVTFTDYPGPPDIPAGTGEDEHGEYGEDEDFEEEFDDSETITLILNRVNNLEALYANIADDMAKQADTLEALKAGVNTIGEMMNGVAQAFDQIMSEVQKGGVAGLLGTIMGGKKNV